MSMLDKNRKRPFVCSKSLLDLKSMITQNVTLNNNTEKIDECEAPAIEKKKRKESKSFPNRNVRIEYSPKSSFSNRRIITTKKQQNFESLSKRIVIQKKDDIPTSTRVVISNSEQSSPDTCMNSNNEVSPITSRLPISSSMCLFDSSASSFNIKPLLSFSARSSNFINEEYATQVRQIISSWNNHENELKSNNSTLSNANDNDHKPTGPNKYFKIELSTNRTVIDHPSQPTSSPLRRPYPQFESVRTPVHDCSSSIPFELLDCCESNQQSTNSDYRNSFHTSVILRETMINISKRLAKNQSLPIVDTHCHFDLIFDRLYIKHNDVKKYFDDYKDLYPSGLSFELAIHVFWRPRHLTEENWTNWYSKYLNDERVYGACGIHPHWSSSWNETCIEDIVRCLKHPKIVAIGEIGLDFGRKNTCNIDQQRRVFEEQLKLAAKWFKPIVIHSRAAYKQTFDIMKQNLESNHKIHLHCFVGTIDDVQLFTSYFTEIKFGFTPLISRGNFLHTVIQQLDLTQILCETDSPYFVPEELSKFSRCAHPGMVYSVVEIVAQIRQLSVYDLACQLRENARHIYGV